jgi:hypothetical protein
MSPMKNLDPTPLLDAVIRGTHNDARLYRPDGSRRRKRKRLIATVEMCDCPQSWNHDQELGHRGNVHLTTYLFHSWKRLGAEIEKRRAGGRYRRRIEILFEPEYAEDWNDGATP